MNRSFAGAPSRVASLFSFEKYETTFSREVIAGVSIYLSLAYIFVVNPAILSKSGLNPSAVLFATVLVSSISTLVMGFWARLPFAVAPGLEMNGFFAFVVCGTLGMTWQQGLGTVFFSGLLCILFTALRVRHDIIDAIPTGLKRAIAASVGAFVATIGLFLSHILTFSNGHIDFSKLSVASFGTHVAWVMYIGVLVCFLSSKAVPWFKGGMLVAILVGALLCYVWGITAQSPPALGRDMFQALGQLDVSIILSPRFWSPIFIFFIIDFVGGIGKFIGLTANTNIQDEHGNVPNLQRGLYIDGAGTVAGAMVGTSSLIAFVESAVGIEAGGRTGLTAVVCGLLMAGSFIFAPFLRWVPAEAAAGVLLYVGYLLVPKYSGEQLPGETRVFDMLIAAAMVVVSIATFSLDKALAIGFWAYFLQSLTLGVDRRRSVWLGIIAVILTTVIVWQLLISS